MKKKLLLLEELQEIDTAIDLTRAEQAVHQAAITGLEAGVATLHGALADEQARLAAIEQMKRELEIALQAEQDNIRRSEGNMKEIRTNKEFQAVGREIAMARKQAAELEEQILQKTAQLEELQGGINARTGELETLQATTDVDRRERQEAMDGLQGTVDTALEKRERIVKELPAGLVRRYAKLREQRRGQALAEARDGSCTGCNMQLPPQLYNTLFRGDELHACPHCQRILVLKQEQG